MTTSSDGWLVATAQPATASVLLTVNFTGSSGIAAGSTVTVTRTTTAVPTATTVRGLDGVLAPGGVIVGYDHEAPLGVLLTYTATVRNAAGTVLHTSSTATETVGLQSSGIWLKNILTPSLSILVTGQAYPDWTYGINQGIFNVLNRADPVTKSDVRQYATGTLTVVGLTGTASSKLKTFLQAPGPYFIQFGNSSVDESDVYVTVGAAVSRRPIRISQDSTRLWELPLTTVGRPSTTGSQVAIPGHTYADSTVRWPLYSNRTSTYLTRATT